MDRETIDRLIREATAPRADEIADALAELFDQTVAQQQQIAALTEERDRLKAELELAPIKRALHDLDPRKAL